MTPIQRRKRKRRLKKMTIIAIITLGIFAVFSLTGCTRQTAQPANVTYNYTMTDNSQVINGEGNSVASNASTENENALTNDQTASNSNVTQSGMWKLYLIIGIALAVAAFIYRKKIKSWLGFLILLGIFVNTGNAFAFTDAEVIHHMCKEHNFSGDYCQCIKKIGPNQNQLAKCDSEL